MWKLIQAQRRRFAFLVPRRLTTSAMGSVNFPVEFSSRWAITWWTGTLPGPPPARSRRSLHCNGFELKLVEASSAKSATGPTQPGYLTVRPSRNPITRRLRRLRSIRFAFTFAFLLIYCFAAQAQTRTFVSGRQPVFSNDYRLFIKVHE